MEIKKASPLRYIASICSLVWKSRQTLSWSSLFQVTFLAAYLYIFNEWLFSATKPSFLNNLALLQQLRVFFTTGALLTSLCFLCLLPLVILGLVPPLKHYNSIVIRLGGLLPAVVFATLILILVDNFTYTVFRFGIVSTGGWSRALYGLGYILVTVACYWRVLLSLDSLSRQTRRRPNAPKWIFALLPGALILSLIPVINIPNGTRASSLTNTSAGGAGLRPHILLITVDGVDAARTSVYGYDRETTPCLEELAKSALVAENAFTNAESTTGSVASIYTGKYPAKTMLFYSHNTLVGADAYEHLPGILKAQGYRTVQITVPVFLDANQWNLLNGFDEVKISNTVYSKYLNILSKVLPRDIALFTDEIFKRVVDRIRHIFFINRMTNPYLLVTEMPALRVDLERWENLKQEIHTARQPLFVHIHLMGTHGKEFNPVQQKFSAGTPVNAQGHWNEDFFDDSILEFDQNVGELVDDLTHSGLLDKTLLIITSDHGHQLDKTSKRLPFILRFPNGQYAGKIQANVQHIDIAPTVLDYIGIDQPRWMSGKSLIAGELEQRPIFGASTYDESGLNPDNVDYAEGASQPCDDITFVTLIYCQKRYQLDLLERSWESGMVEGSTSACQPGSDITDEQAFQLIVEHLEQNGVDLSTLIKLP